MLSVADQAIIWRAKNNHNRGEFGIISVDHVIWSPDSRHIAMPVLIDTDHGVDEQILVLDILVQPEVSGILISNIGNKILDMVWIAD